MTDRPLSDGPTRLLNPPEDAPANSPTRSVPIRPRVNRPAPLTMTLARPGDPVIPGYRIIRRLGRGGMGVVFQAVHMALNRAVALKMLGGSAYEIDDETRSRFRKEAESLASLRHPNIVPVYEVGEAEGLPFFTMELVEGGDLATLLREHPPTPAEAARLAAQLARGVEAAHAQGILHRDLKPANVLLANAEVGSRNAEGIAGPESFRAPSSHVRVPKVADFGLAKRFGAARGTDRTMTLAGDILGTPSYMAPEQAEGHGSAAIGPAADIYSLGAILYEMLAHRPPFDAGDPVRTVIQVLNDDPVPPHKLVTRVPRDLETICLKCLEKDPRKRYPTAGALAEDLERFSAGRPIVARPVSAPERVWKWARRRPAIAGMLATTGLAIVAAFLGITAMWIRANDRAMEEAEARRNADAALQLADLRGEALERQAHVIEYQLSRGYLDRGLAASETNDVPRGLVLMARALENTAALRARVTDPAELARVEHLDWIIRANLAAWQTRLALRPRATFRTPEVGNDKWVLDVDLSPDGRRVLTGSRDGYLRVFDAETHAEIGQPTKLDEMVFGTAFSPDGKQFVMGRQHEKRGGPVVEVRDTETKAVIGPSIPYKEYEHAPPYCIFGNFGFASADLLLVQTDPKAIRFFKPGTGEEAAPTIRTDVPVSVCVPLAGGTALLTGHGDGTVRRWDVKSGKEVARTTVTDTVVFALAASADGKRVASGHWRGMVRVWDATTLTAGPVLNTRAVTENGGPNQWKGFLRALDFAPDGKSLVAGGGLIDKDANLQGYLQTWDAASGAELYSFYQPRPVWGVAYSGDGGRVVTVSEDCSIRVWSAFDGAPLHTYMQIGNPGKVLVGKDGRSVLAADLGAVANPQLADLGPPAQAYPAIKVQGPVINLRFTPEGDLVAVGSDRTVRRYDPTGTRPVVVWPALPAERKNVRISSDGTTVASWDRVDHVGDPLEIDVWGQPGTKRYTVTQYAPTSVEILPSGGGLLTLPYQGHHVRGWGPDGKNRWEFPLPDKRTPDAYTLHAVRTDGSLAVVGSAQAHVAYVMDPNTGERHGTPWELPGRLAAIAITSDGNGVAFGFHEGFLQTFDLRTREPVGATITIRGEWPVVSFRPDGKALAILTDFAGVHSVTQYDPVTGVSIGPSLQVPFPLRHHAMSYHPNSKVLAVGDQAGMIRFWNVPTPLTGEAEQVRLWAEMVARTEMIMGPTEMTRHLDDRRIGERRKRLREGWGGEPGASGTR